MRLPRNLLFGLLWTVTGVLASVAPPARDLTFFHVSDTHYGTSAAGDEALARLVEAMNTLPGADYPADLGGTVGKPRGVIHTGDITNDGKEAQWRLFVRDYGLNGRDGKLRWPVFETFGNHDGGEKLPVRAGIRERNRTREGLAAVSDNDSWDWDDVHFVQLNFYAANTQRAGVKYSPVWHDPQGSLDFLKADLAAKVGASGRPVVLMSHCGFDTDWWTKEDWREFYDAARGFNVVLYLYGHSGTSVGAWSPEGEVPAWNVINDGQTEKGFFVIRITGDRLRAAMRVRARAKPAQKESAPQWEWKWLLDTGIGEGQRGR